MIITTQFALPPLAPEWRNDDSQQNSRWHQHDNDHPTLSPEGALDPNSPAPPLSEEPFAFEPVELPRHQEEDSIQDTQDFQNNNNIQENNDIQPLRCS